MFDIKNIMVAGSSDEAIAALLKHRQALLIAGGTDVLIKLREGKLENCRLISIHDAEDLKGISLDEQENIRIGPLTTFRELAESPLLQERAPLLAQAAATVGGPQIRAVGTVGGNLCNGATSADTAPALLALGAKLELKGPGGIEPLSVCDFYQGPGKVRMAHNQLLYCIVLEKEHYGGYHGAYIKYAMRNAMDISTLGVAVLLKLGEDLQRIADIRVALGVAAPTPVRAYGTEAALREQELGTALESIAGLVRAEINPRDSWRASRDFRLQIAGENAARALRQAIRTAVDNPKTLTTR